MFEVKKHCCFLTMKEPAHSFCREGRRSQLFSSAWLRKMEPLIKYFKSVKTRCEFGQANVLRKSAHCCCKLRSLALQTFRGGFALGIPA